MNAANVAERLDARPGSAGRGSFAETYGPWAVVTGASDGIGRAFARAFAERGVSVVLVARRGEVLRSVAADLESRYRVETLVLAADLCSEDGVAEVFEATQTLDVGTLVAAAGFGTSGSLIHANLATELEMVDVNCRAVLAFTHHFGSRFVDRGGGTILLLSSIVAFQGVSRAANYAATKAYVQSLAEGLHFELKPHGVRVFSVAPGPVESGFGRRAQMTISAGASPESVAEGAVRSLRRGLTKRPGVPAKVLGWSLALLPRSLRVRVMTFIMGAMTKGRP